MVIFLGLVWHTAYEAQCGIGIKNPKRISRKKSAPAQSFLVFLLVVIKLVEF